MQIGGRSAERQAFFSYSYFTVSSAAACDYSQRVKHGGHYQARNSDEGGVDRASRPFVG